MRVVWLAALAVLLLGIVFILIPKTDVVSRSDKVAQASSITEGGELAQQKGFDEKKEVKLITQSPFIESYGASDGSIEDDLEILQVTLSECTLIIKDYDQFFLPDNEYIVKFLQGKNPDRLAWLPLEHEFINDSGQVTDRLGIPVYFHRLKGFQYELRSAGLDKLLWTGDDIIVK